MSEINPRLVRCSRFELESMRDMSLDAINDGSPFAEQLQRYVEQIERILATKFAGASVPVVDDDVQVGRRAGSAASNQYGTFTVHAASERQVAFLAKLIATKDTTGVKIPSTLDGISKKSASALIDQLINRPLSAAGAAAAPKASEKQVQFLRSLLASRDVTGCVFNLRGQEIETLAQWETLVESIGPRDASAAIEHLKALPYQPRQPKPQTPTAQELTVGAYRTADGRIIRVYPAKADRNRLLASELTDPSADSSADAWTYLGMASRFVTASDKLTADQVEDLAHQIGTESFTWCCVCGRKLDDPNSVSRGIGPICRAKQGGGQ